MSHNYLQMLESVLEKEADAKALYKRISSQFRRGAADSVQGFASHFNPNGTARAGNPHLEMAKNLGVEHDVASMGAKMHFEQHNKYQPTADTLQKLKAVRSQAVDSTHQKAVGVAETKLEDIKKRMASKQTMSKVAYEIDTLICRK